MWRSRKVWMVVGLTLVGLVVAVVLLVALREWPIASGPTDRTLLRSEDSTRDPRWQGFHNRRLGRCTTTRQDIGPRGSATIGGLVTRAARPAWFGRREALDFERPFTATGQLQVRRQRDEPFPAGSALVGFFNAANRDWRPPNQLGFQINGDPVAGGDYSISLAYGSRDFQTAHAAYGRSADRPRGLRFGVRYGWRLAYDPAAAGGRGQATLSIPRAGPPVALVLTPAARRSGATLDRFGLGNQTVARGRALDLVVSRLAVDGVSQDPTRDPAAWDGRGRRVAYRDCLTGQPNSFGWTGPRDRRMGGLVSRTDEESPRMRAFYADRVGHLTLDDPLHVEGTVSLARANSDSATLLGWFARGTSARGSAELAPPGFLGVAITGPSRVGQYLSPLVADRRGHVAPDDGTGIILNPGPATYRWSLDYRPGAGRFGEMTVRLGARRVTWGLTRKLREAGATLNRFGIRNVERGGSFQVVLFDDLRYTAGVLGAQPRGDRHAAKKDRPPRRSGDRRAPR